MSFCDLLVCIRLPSNCSTNNRRPQNGGQRHRLSLPVATVNVGASGNMTTSTDTASALLPLDISPSQTKPATEARPSDWSHCDYPDQRQHDAKLWYLCLVQRQCAFDPAVNPDICALQRCGWRDLWLKQRGSADAVTLALAERRSNVALHF
jgi:hypothetical protein